MHTRTTALRLPALLAAAVCCGSALADRSVKTAAELASAIANAASGETIFIAPGEYDITSFKQGSNYYHLYTGNRQLTLEGTDATSWRNNGNKTKAVIKGGYGGSEHVFGFAANITLKNLTFTGAYKTPAGASLHRNGSGFATVSNCVFASNKSTYRGGAVNASGVFQDCLFDANTADALGGAIYADQSDGVLKCVGCSFVNDKTSANQGQGGAIYQSAGTVEIVDCSFVSCAGNGGYTAAGYRAGGAIYAAGGTTTVSNTTFTSCTAPYSGGAIVVGSKGNLEAVRCAFTSCIAYERGGAVEGGTYRDCVFASNESWRGGAAANVVGAYDCVFTNNVCKSGDGVGGALWHTAASAAVVSGCTFVKNSVSAQQGFGGAIYQSAGELLVSNTTFASCSATGGYTASGYRSGGAICENGGAIEVVDSVFTNCTAVQQRGGAINARNGSVTARGCTFVGNVAVDGGAVNCNDATFLTNCTFRANKATSAGGAVSTGTNVVDCTFADNASAYFSGHCWNSVIRNSIFGGLGSVGNSKCLNCVFDGARTTSDNDWNRGLVIAVNNSPHTAECVNCLFVNCDCFYMLQSWGLPLSIVNCTFADNKANSYFAYGADYNGLGTGAKFDFDNSVFNGARSAQTGHGLQVNIQADSSGVVTVDHCVAETVEIPKGAAATELTVAKARFVGPAHRSGAPAYTPRHGDGNVVGKGLLLDWTANDLDLAGNPRVRDGKVSLGCYEPWYERLGFVLDVR